jgi:hypothetical protein
LSWVKGITAAVEIGSHNPVHLLEPSLKLTPVIVTITAAQIATAKSTKETVTKGLGIEGAAIGGIVGGLRAGFAGVDPITGARPGGAIGGRLGEAAAVVVVGEQSLRATLTSGALVGHFPLVYTPFLRVRLISRPGSTRNICLERERRSRKLVRNTEKMGRRNSERSSKRTKSISRALISITYKTSRSAAVTSARTCGRSIQGETARLASISV